VDAHADGSMACRTDSIMLVSVNPEAQRAGVLSIPRDLWIEIPHPDHEVDRINTAHFGGEKDYAGGGPALARVRAFCTLVDEEELAGTPTE
jgi:anionic cell wall polymer biosynthesis LytR-Cps2A-Psr (LCP) family protein